MNDSLLNLSFNHWGVFLLSAIPALINLGIFTYAIFFLPHNKINNAFYFFVLLLGITQTCGGLMRMNVSEEIAKELPRMSAIPLVFALSFGLLFTLRFTVWNKKIKESKLFMLLFLLPLLFNFLMLARLDKYTIVKSELWNWIVNPEPTLITNSIYLWIVGIGLITLALLWLYYFKGKKGNQKKKQALLLAVGYTIPFVGGSITEIIFPFILHLDTIPLTAPLITAFSVASLVAIKKYHMLDYSPRHQWDTIVKTMNEGILIVDNTDQIMFANEAFCSMLGYTFEEIEGRVAREVFVNEIRNKVQIESFIEERKSKKSSQYEIQLQTQAGEKIWVLISGSPYLDHKGNVIGSIGIHMDITERTKTEDLLKKTNQELETFIYKASHDLRAPLCSIMGLVNVSKLEINDAKAMQFLNMIDTSTKRLDNILISLVQSMHVKDTKRMDEDIDFDQLISETLKKMEHAEGYSRVIITNSVTIRSPFYSSKFIMESIFQNIIENAIKYQNYTTKESFLKISITENNRIIQLIFEDNGIGIDSSFHTEIFEMYFKAHNESKGSGLGLYIVSAGIKRLNGKIEIESERGKGTKFLLSLPCLGI